MTKNRAAPCTLLSVAVAALLAAGIAPAQDTTRPAADEKSTDEKIEKLTQEVEQLKVIVHQLQDQLSKNAATTPVRPSAASASPSAASVGPGAVSTTPRVLSGTPSTPTPPPQDPLQGVTINAMLDGYYEFNLNAPIGRVNELRAYDVSSNSFSLNQADLVIEKAPDLSVDRRFGMRVDLQFGQATSTLQGSPVNELRPDVYRNIFQAYGTYIAPVANGLSVDFGKWASSLGIEGNYTKDQLNYSRAFLFDYLPFYHMGLRSKLMLSDAWAMNVWITNGTNQTEAFNNYKDQMFGVVFTPSSALSWTFNFYNGQEHPDIIYIQNPTLSQLSLPNQQGTYILPIANPPDGRLHIFDTYVSWQVSKALYLALEADRVEDRFYSTSPLDHVAGAAFYAGYQLSAQFAVAARGEYLADIGGLFSGTTQYLKEGTLTVDYRPVDGFLLRGEYRHDQSNRPYFLGHTLGNLQNDQPTVGLGVVWWFGQKEGAW